MWIAALAVGGLAVSGYLALYQLKVFDHVWEPGFGSGSERVLQSSLSRLLPIPDAAVGAAAYALDAVTGLIGGQDRWRSMPWMVVCSASPWGPSVW